MVEWSLPLDEQLRWCLHSPHIVPSTKRLPLLDMPADFLGPDTLPSREILEAHCREFGHWRVGLHFEALFTCWLSHHPRLELLARNTQVFIEKRTLGAFDFLVRLETGVIEHWEIAVKFYLLDGDENEFRHWMGPRRRDRLDIKVDRMADHQLPLSSHPAGQKKLMELGLSPDSVSTRALLKGLLFYPMTRTGLTGPHAVWVRQSDLLHIPGLETVRWQPRMKPDWLGPTSLNTTTQVGDAEFRRALASRRIDMPEMWSLCRRKDADTVEEVNRCFIVQDSWGRD